MGEVAWKALGDQLYSLGVIAHEGNRFLRRAPARSMISSRAGLIAALVDFRHPPAGGEWLHALLAAQLLRHIEMRADWSRVVDGVLFCAEWSAVTGGE